MFKWRFFGNNGNDMTIWDFEHTYRQNEMNNVAYIIDEKGREVWWLKGWHKPRDGASGTKSNSISKSASKVHINMSIHLIMAWIFQLVVKWHFSMLETFFLWRKKCQLAVAAGIVISKSILVQFLPSHWWKKGEYAKEVGKTISGYVRSRLDENFYWIKSNAIQRRFL